MKVGIIRGWCNGNALRYHLAQRCTVTMLDDDAEVAGPSRATGFAVNGQPVREVQVAERSRDLYDYGTLPVRQGGRYLARAACLCRRNESRHAGGLIAKRRGQRRRDETALGGAVPVILGITTESSSDEPGTSSSSLTRHTILGSTSASWPLRAE